MSHSIQQASRAKKPRSRKRDIIDVGSIGKLELLNEEERSTLSLPSGFCIRFCCHDMQNIYTVASENVLVTRGVMDYMHDFNRLGPNKSHNRTFLCTQYNKDRTCLNGTYCREVHCTVKVEDAQDARIYGVPSNATGAPFKAIVIPADDIVRRRLDQVCPTPSMESSKVSVCSQSAPLNNSLWSSCSTREDSNTNHTVYIPEGIIVYHSLHSRWTSRNMCPSLPAGVTFKVALPNTPTPVDTYDSSELFVTKGAQEYYDQRIAKEPSSITMQHCAHYSKNGICCFGENCQFIHALYLNTREGGTSIESFSDAESSVGSMNSNDNRSRRSRRPDSAHNDNTLSIHVPPSNAFSPHGMPMSHPAGAIGSYVVSSPGMAPPTHSTAVGQNSLPSNPSFTNVNSWIAPPPHRPQQQDAFSPKHAAVPPPMSQVGNQSTFVMVPGVGGNMYLVPQQQMQQQMQQQYYVMQMPLS